MRTFNLGRLIFVVILLFPSTLFGEINFYSPLSPEETARELLNRMSEEEVLGQIFMIGYIGTSPSVDLLNWIEEKHIGGVKIFGWNVGTLPELAEGVGTMQKAAADSRWKIPLFIATDQEGGWVRHIKAETTIGVGNIALGATGLPYDAFNTGYYIGQELRVLGINFNFAPTVDVYSNPEAHVIGPRSFSDDPVKTAELALAYYNGLKTSGIIATAKHYPGHGDTQVDSHGAMPHIEKSFEQLWERDLVPFRHLIHEGIPAIMCGHLAFPDITGSGNPATLSDFFLTELLRDKLKFEGIAITDDLIMHGVTETGLSIPEISETAISAGNDILLISQSPWTHQRVWDRLFEKMTTDETFRSRIYESAERVLKIKCEYLRSPNAIPLYPETEKVFDHIPNREGQTFFFDLACRSVSVVKDGNIPISFDESENVLLIGQFHTFIRIGQERHPQSDGYFFPYENFYIADPEYFGELRYIIPQYDTVIYCLANPNSAQILKWLEPTFLENDIRIILFSVLNPTYLYEFPWVDTALALYGFGEDSFQAGWAVLDGEYIPEGTFPINFEDFYNN